jgi:hypothetical protein
MARTIGFILLLGFALLFCSPAVTSAETLLTFSPADQPALAADPFLAQGVVSTSIFEAFKCDCAVTWNCPFRDIGFDCAEPPNCCHCSGSDPATRKCVKNI